MSFSLHPAEVHQKLELTTEAHRALDALIDIIDEANTAARNYQRAIDDAATAYNLRASDLGKFAEQVAVKLRAQFNSHPGQWQDSPEGEAVASFISEWEAFWPVAEFDPEDIPGIEPPDADTLSQFASLPNEP